MGDRAVVVFKKTWQEGEGKKTITYSPGLYLHSSGYRMRETLKKVGPNIRKGDDSYSLARLTGVFHNILGGNGQVLGMGIFAGPTKKDVKNNFTQYTQGDAGVFVVDIDTGEVDVFAGYEAENGPFTIENLNN